MKVLLINDSTSNPNWGDRAAAIALKKMISDSGGNIITTISEDDLMHSSFHNASYKQQGYIYKDNVKETLKSFIPPLLIKMREDLFTYMYPAMYDDIIPQTWHDFEHHSQLVFIKNRHLSQI